MFTIGNILFKTTDFLILLSVSSLIIWLYSVFWSTDTLYGQAETLQVQYYNQVAIDYPLDTDRIIKVEGSLGSSIIEIKQGKARFIHSSCRNQFCVFHGWLNIVGDSTACLPNRVSIRLKGTLNPYDAIAGSQ
ncbi:MAG: NusG domain II-containing protein [Bacteroidales bacterium]|nr:NusG domain II-containing protein [Bacteroidales bacterium]